MPRPDRIQTLNGNYARGGGKSIDAGLYAAVRRAILAAVPRGGEGALFRDLPDEVARRVPRDLLRGRSAAWYTTTVKLDLEARGLIRRIAGATPQRLLRVGRPTT